MLWHHSLSVGALKLFEQVEILDSTNILFYGVSPLNLSNSVIELYSEGSSHYTDETFPRSRDLFRIHKESHSLIFLFKPYNGISYNGVG